jgi:hypothetical protein
MPAVQGRKHALESARADGDGFAVGLLACEHTTPALQTSVIRHTLGDEMKTPPRFALPVSVSFALTVTPDRAPDAAIVQRAQQRRLLGIIWVGLTWDNRAVHFKGKMDHTNPECVCEPTHGVKTQGVVVSRPFREALSRSGRT